MHILTIKLIVFYNFLMDSYLIKVDSKLFGKFNLSTTDESKNRELTICHMYLTKEKKVILKLYGYWQ